MEKVMKKSLLFLSENAFFTKIAKKYGLQYGASRFVAGETIHHATKVIKSINEKGFKVTIDHLGEFVEDRLEADENADECIVAIKEIASKELDSQVSLKLTSIGLDISEKVALDNMNRIMKVAEEYKVFVTIDMESYSRCHSTIELYKKLKSRYENIGTVIQAYLHRSESDIVELNSLSPNLRLVKGAYKESHYVAFPKKKDVDDNFQKLICMHLLNGNFTAIASHDDRIIDFTKTFVQNNNIPKEQFEFQMLYGICKERQQQLLEEGYQVRVYLPYGKDWYGYLMRRMAERPANVQFVLKGMFK